MASNLIFRSFVCCLAGAVLAAGCTEDSPPGKTYYERSIDPILQQFCASNTAGCHAVNPEDPFSFAAGNLDVTSFENVQKRRDTLVTFGPYPVPLMLIKGVGATGELGVTYEGAFRPLEVQHSGGNVLQVGSEAYLTLLTWMQKGATENGLRPVPKTRVGAGACSKALSAGFDPAIYTSNPNFGEFRDKVQPILESCNSGSCHGAAQADFYISCGATEEELAFNFSQVWAFVDDPVDNSQMLQIPLAVNAGGSFHSGGDQFATRNDATYNVIKTWAQNVGRLRFGVGDPAKEFFVHNVQPVLLQRGCSFEACHSPSATNDFKLRSGSQGFFSAISTERNYNLLKREFLAFEVPDIRRGRAVAKNILPQFGGIAHRGGPSLETPGSGGADPSTCDTPYDPATASAYCTFQEWLNIERQSLLAAGDVLPLRDGDSVPLVYVDRAETFVATPLEFDSYQPDSDLLVATAALGPESAIVSVGSPTSLLTNCGLGGTSVVDVRGPDVAVDGNRVAFAARDSASAPLSIYVVALDTLACSQVTPAQPDQNGMKVHNFDPSWSPDGQWIVFASTRGTDGAGPSVSRKLFLPQSDIWRMRADGSGAEAMTFLSNSEVSPQWMREGRVIMTTEKVSEGFYQLSGRRINWDITDYHPLLGQRAQSALGDAADPTALRPSVGYEQATEIREGLDGNFIFVASDSGARGGAGTLAVFNRSVGPMEAGRDDPGYLKSLTIIDPRATGRVGSATSGAYRSPYALPSGRLMASYSSYSGDLAAATSFDWDIVSVDKQTGERTVLVGGPRAQLEAVLAIKEPIRPFFINRRQLVFGGGVNTVVTGGEDMAVIHMPDAPLIFTLLTANLRRGRPDELYRNATHVAAYVEGFAPSNTTVGGGAGGIYENRVYAGRVPLREDGSVRFRAPAKKGVILSLQDESGNTLVTMTEEHQLGPGEVISMGIKADLFDAVCGGCHGSVSGSELDVVVSPDALTGASESLASGTEPVDLAP